MRIPLNLFHQFLATATSATNAASLTDEEVILQYPAISVTAAILLFLGLICDGYLLYQFARPSRSQEVPALEAPRFKIDPKPWSAQDLVYAAGALLLVLATGGLIVVLALKFTHLDDDAALPWLLGADMVGRVAVLFGFAAFFRWRKINWRDAIGIQRGSTLRAVVMGAMFFLAVLPLVAGAYVGYSKLCSLVGIKDDPQPIADLLASSDSKVVVALIVVFAVTIAPVCEEFFFRGFVYPVLKKSWGMGWALTAVSLVFAAIHFHLPTMGPLFVLAIGLGLAYEFTGSLLTPIAMHALFNAANVAMVLYVRAHS